MYLERELRRHLPSMFGHTMNAETQRTDILNERLAATLNEGNFTVEYRKTTRDGVSVAQLREIYLRQKQQAVERSVRLHAPEALSLHYS